MQKAIPNFKVCVCLQYAAVTENKMDNCMPENCCDVSVSPSREGMIYMRCSMKLANVFKTSCW